MLSIHHPKWRREFKRFERQASPLDTGDCFYGIAERPQEFKPMPYTRKGFHDPRVQATWWSAYLPSDPTFMLSFVQKGADILATRSPQRSRSAIQTSSMQQFQSSWFTRTMIIDLRSGYPWPSQLLGSGMHFSAPVGDDVLVSDPMVNAWRKKFSKLFEMEADSFLSIWSMTNQIYLDTLVSLFVIY